MSDDPISTPRSLREDGLPALQREVQRWLGRCLLRIQQYERLLKALVVHHELIGPLSRHQRIQQERVQVAATRTLGKLVEQLLDHVILAEGIESTPGQTDAQERALPLGFRFTIRVTTEDHALLTDGLKELVDMRNGLVHHFIEQHDVWTVSGCAQAREYLTAAYTRIDERWEQLRAWVMALEQSKSLARSFIGSSQHRELISGERLAGSSFHSGSDQRHART